MDGNGRWAKKLNLPRTKGHTEGLKTTKKIVTHAAQLGIRYLSLYVFSTENWKRSHEEIGSLMNLISAHLKSQLHFYREYSIRLVHSGNTDRLDKKILKDLEEITFLTKDHSGLTLNLLINYGGQDEIVRSCNKILKDNKSITIDSVSQYLDQPFLPPLDCIIRTASEHRISNFMIWQAAYAEFIYSSVFWPEYTTDDFNLSLNEYARRNRTFGGE